MSRDGDDHLISLIGMMGSSTAAGDGEAINAFRVATRALAKRGLTWRELAERGLGAPAPKPIWQGPTPTPSPDAPRYADRTSAPPPPPPPPPPPDPEKPRKRGFDVPPAISGIVRIIDDDRKAKLLIVEVEGRDARYGPLLAYAGTVRDTLLAANNRYGTLRVRPPRHETSMPQIVACSSS